MEKATYLVTKEIAERSGLLGSRYMISDGRYVLNDRDLARVRLSADEYINGLKGAEKVDSNLAKNLIRQNGFKFEMEDTFSKKEESAELPLNKDFSTDNEEEEE